MTIQYCISSDLVVHRRFCQLQTNSPVIAFWYIFKLKINAPTMYHTYRKLCQSPKPKFFLMFWLVAMVDSKQQRNWVCACLETIKTHYPERPLSKSRNMRFLQSDWLYFNNDVFSCEMVHLVHLGDETLSKKGISFITLILRMIT